MKYLSLFSGIGGFEVAIHNLFPDAICIGYSEVKPSALKVYQHHYPHHDNLGDITKITKDDIKRQIKKYGGCDLVVAGFPCTNLTSIGRLSGVSTGIHGSESGLFKDLLRILKYIYTINPSFAFIIENNPTMNSIYKEYISRKLKNIVPQTYMTIINSLDVGCFQKRRRLFWTNFEIIEQYKKTRHKKWVDVLDDNKQLMTNRYVDNTLNAIVNFKTNDANKYYETKIAVPHTKNLWYFKYVKLKGGKTRWSINKDIIQSTKNPYVSTIAASFDYDTILLKYRSKNYFYITYLSRQDIEKLFCYPKGYVTSLIKSKSVMKDLYGNSVLPPVIQYILKNTRLL